MGPQVELLEYHRQVRADAGDLAAVRRAAVQAGAFPRDRFAAEQHFALLAVLEQVRTAQQR